MKKQVTLLFSTITDTVVYTFDKVVDIPDSSSVYTKKVFLDPITEKWSGTSQDGGVVPKGNEKMIMRESELNYSCQKEIEKEYPIQRQLAVIYDQLDTISEKFTDKYAAMREYITETIKINGNFKRAFSQDPNTEYENAEEGIKKYNEMYKNGRLEKMGVHDIDRPFAKEELITDAEI